MTKLHARLFVKKIFCVFCFLVFGQMIAYRTMGQQFTAGHLVVERVGDGSPQSTAGTPIFLDEFSITGISGVSLALPTVNVASVNRTVASGTDGSEGMLSRSVDGKFLAVPGYDATPGTPNVAFSGANKVVTRVDPNGNFASTVVSDASAFSFNIFRSVVTTDGSEYWLSGTGNGAIYVTHQGNTTAVTGTEVTNDIADNRSLFIFNSQLYQSTAIGPNTGVYNVGVGLPTSVGNTMTLDANSGPVGDVNAFVIMNNGIPVMYVADFSNKLIRKYYKVGSVWLSAGSVTVTVGGVATGFYGLTGNVAGGVVHLYATTANIAGSNSRVVTFNDATTASTVVVGSVVSTTIVGPTTNMAFRGITFVPFSVTGISTAAPSVCTGSGTTITISGNPGTTITYQKGGVTQPAATISGGGTFSFPTGPIVANTTYTVLSATDGGITQTYAYNVTVSINPLPAVTSTGATGMCIGLSAPLTASGTLTYTWAPAAGLSSTTGSAVSASPVATTTYTVTGTDINGCVNRSTVTVTINPLPSITTGTPVAICIGGSAGLAGGGGIAYTWAPAVGLSSTVGSYVVASPTVTTTYTITGTNTNGCSNTMTNTVTVNLLPIVSTSPGVAMCFGSSTGLTASGASTYIWSPGTGLSSAGGASVTATPAATTSYTVTGTDIHGCVNRASVTVTINPLPIVSAGPGAAICIGASTGLTASGATDYVWTPATGLSGTTGSSLVATPTVTTTYSVTGTDINGCVSRSAVTIVVHTLPIVSGTGGGICPGSATAIWASGTIAYTWAPASGLSATVGTTVIASPLSTTVYTITGTNGFGCVSNATVTVTVYPIPAVSAGSSVAICNGSSTALTATGALTYSWAPGFGLSVSSGSSVVAHPSATTTYTVTGISTCINRATVTVSVNPLPAVAAPGATICSGSSVGLTATGAATYSWIPATGLSTTVGGSVTASPTANTIYTITGTDANGCVNRATSAVMVNLLPPVSAGTPVSICNGSSTTLTATGGATYSWSPSTGLSATVGSSVIANPSSTTTYTITGTSTYGCIATTTKRVNVNPLPALFAVTGGGSFCAGTSGVPVGLSGSQGGINYQLLAGSVYTGISRSGLGSALDFGHPFLGGFYTIKAIDPLTGCTDTMSGGVGQAHT